MAMLRKEFIRKAHGFQGLFGTHRPECRVYIPVSIRILKVFRELPRDRKKQKNTESGSLLAMMIYEDSRQTWLVSAAEPLHFRKRHPGVPLQPAIAIRMRICSYAF